MKRVETREGYEEPTGGRCQCCGIRAGTSDITQEEWTVWRDAKGNIVKEELLQTLPTKQIFAHATAELVEAVLLVCPDCKGEAGRRRRQVLTVRDRTGVLDGKRRDRPTP